MFCQSSNQVSRDAHLHETNDICLLTEALSADIKTVFTNDTSWVTAYTAERKLRKTKDKGSWVSSEHGQELESEARLVTIENRN